MKIILVAFFLSLITTTAYSSNDEVNTKDLHDKCGKRSITTEKIMDQLERIDQIDVENFHTLWIITNNNFDENKKFVEHLADNKISPSVTSENKNYLYNYTSLLKENILLYSLNETKTRSGYLLYPESIKTINEIIVKYFVKKLTDNALEVKMLTNSHSVNFLISSINNLYEQRLKNSTGEHVDKSEIDLWFKFYLKSLAEMNKEVFNFTFTTQLTVSQEMDCLKLAINNDLIVGFYTLANFIFDHYFHLENATNTEIFTKEVIKAHVILKSAIDETSRIIDTEKIVHSENFDPLTSAFNSLQIRIPGDYFLLIAKKINWINFLSMRTWTKPSLLLDPLRRIIENEIGFSILWYEKLNVAYIAASRSLSDNLHKTMKMKIKELSEHFSFKALNSKMKELQLKELEYHSFDRDLSKECILINSDNETYKLQIHGDFINFKDIPDIEICNGRTRYIELFARDVIIINKDLIKKGDNVQIVAIAPKWIVSGLRMIDLTGADGEDHDLESAEVGQLGVRGEDGLPGLPGGPGGIFIGIADEIINKEKLQIIANGGQGGNGQNGGEGGKGPDTRLPTVKDYDAVIFSKKEERRVFPIFVGYKETCFVYFFDLLTTSSGGDGGNGGKGGQGGNAGQIFLVQLNSTFQKYFPKRGSMGHDGLGGSGGSGNFKNTSYEENCSTEINDAVNCENCDVNEKLLLVIHNGTVGQEGTNTKNMKDPTVFVGFGNIASVVNDYKAYARSFMLNSKHEGLFNFYTKLLNSEIINKKYSTFGLLDELKGLERDYSKLSEKMDLLPMYENLQKRIEKYVQHRLDSEMDEDYFVALDYAYTAALTRASRLIETGSYFVSHLQNYLASVSRNLDKLKENIVQYTANQLGEDYKQNIERKIKEARIIIEEQLHNAVNKLNKLMKRKIYAMINETIELRNESQEKKDALNKAMMQQTIFTLVKSALVGISALIPGGQAAAILTFTAVQVGESFAPEYQDKYRTRIPVAVGNRFAGALELVKNSKLEQHRILQNDIEFLRKEKNKLNSLSGSSKIVNQVINTFDHNLDGNGIMESEIKNLDNQIKTLMQKKENDEDGTDYTKVLDVVSKLRAYYNYKQKNTDAVESLEHDAEKKEALKDNIASTENDIKKLQKYENRIYNELIPVFEKMHQDLPSDETIKIQSIVTLDVSKWKVQTALKNVKLIIKQFTKGFRVQDEMNLIIENLEDTMNTLISIYDQIQNFQQEQKLTAYVKQLDNVKFQNFHSKNEKLENSVLETRFIIRANLALIQYEKIFNAFKQFVFPYADKYMRDIKKPSAFEISVNNLDSIHWFEEISDNVHKIKSKIDTIQETIFKNSKFNEKLEYGNKHQGEIYLWQNESHHEMISDLLSGKEVILFPDARNFPHFAVKFTKIRIGFVAKIKADQEHLMDLLNALEMRMIHEGNSYYTCGDKMYLISHSPITLIKTFNESYQGESDSVQKLANGDDLVSPFATWRVQIGRATGGIEENYFANFKNKVDLVLEGIGTYVQVTNTDICDKNTSLTDYYEEYVPIVDFVKKSF